MAGVLLCLAFLLIKSVDAFWPAERECKLTKKGVVYSGRTSTTKSGLTCQRWDSQTPHAHSHTLSYHFPENDVSFAENFCRNPSNEDTGPWCYTTDPGIEREACDIPRCAPFQESCKTSDGGEDYRGKMNFTKTGKICMRWTGKFPHSHSLDDSDFPDDTMSHASNFCRNPDSEDHEEGPWCYTLSFQIEWEYCEIPLCENNFRIASITPSVHQIATDSLTDGYLESCQQLSTPSANDLQFLIRMTSTWEQLNVELAFNSDEVKSCKDSLFFAFYSKTSVSSCNSCEAVTLCQWIEVETDMDKGFCRFTCSCKDSSCQSVTLTVPSQLTNFELCEVKAWSG